VGPSGVVSVFEPVGVEGTVDPSVDGVVPVEAGGRVCWYEACRTTGSATAAAVPLPSTPIPARPVSSVTRTDDPSAAIRP
jgi:hypothetical protein